MNTGNDNHARLASIDALRGFTMLFIMGGAPLVVALCKILPAQLTGFSEFMISQMNHVKWNGLAFEDMIFPIFLFLAGVSFTFSCAKSLEKGYTKSKIALIAFKRMVVLIILGLIYGGLFNLNFAELRYPSVLARIGIAWFFAAIFYLNFKANIRLAICAGILLFYWAIMAPFGYTLESNLVGIVDRAVLPGTLHEKIFDPEGLLSTLPAISTAMLGVFAGELLRSTKLTSAKIVICLLTTGALLIVLGYIWGFYMPINKKLWTSSYVCCVGGISYLLLAFFYGIIDVLKYKRWAFFFIVIGMNSITIYMAQRIVNFRGITQFFGNGLVGLFPQEYQGVVGAACYVVVAWSFLFFLYKNKIFLKV